MTRPKQPINYLKDPQYLLTPTVWSKRARRVFILTLPISGPILVTAWIAFTLLYAAAISVFIILVGLSHLVSPIVVPIISLYEFCCKLWNQHDE